MANRFPLILNTSSSQIAELASGDYLDLTGSGIANDWTASGYLQLTGTAALRIPNGTTAQRPATPNAGDLRYNTTTTKFEGWNGSSWRSVGGGADGGGTDDAFLVHKNTITTSYSISTGYNCISAGPVVVNAGATVTVPDGSTWTIV